MRILLALTLLIFSLQAKSLFSNNSQVETAKYVNSLKDLVIATQKTRGLTNSYLNGNESALLLIHGNQRDMKKAIGVMESLELASNPIIMDRATSISQALIKINNRAFKLKPSVAFDSYTEQIEQILMLAQTVSKQGSKDLNPLAKEVSIVMMEVILPMTEQVGRMRGMGSGIIAKGKITETQKFKMLAMLSEIDDLQDQLQNDLKSIIAKHDSSSCGSSTNQNLAALKKSVKKYTALTSAKVLKGGAGLDSSAYFTEGTDIISILINIFNSNNKSILADSKGFF